PCPTCPAFGPGSTVDMTVMVAPAVFGLPLQPSGPVNDVLSEPSAGTQTTTTTSCASGAGATACELVDNSADAFFQVTYQSPTAVSLQSLTAQERSPGASLFLTALLATLMVSGLFIWRRRAAA
ncbi:MAG: hypothetical protein KC425_03595, partial [Anaerolineales bacterium]|nr:hypothetical protein [Anaerolineales bacterium]